MMIDDCFVSIYIPITDDHNVSLGFLSLLFIVGLKFCLYFHIRACETSVRTNEENANDWKNANEGGEYMNECEQNGECEQAFKSCSLAIDMFSSFLWI